MYWQCKIFLHTYSIKLLYHGVILIGLFLQYLKKCLYVVIWWNACTKKCYTAGAHKLNPNIFLYFLFVIWIYCIRPKINDIISTNLYANIAYEMLFDLSRLIFSKYTIIINYQSCTLINIKMVKQII
jgi:hypothetical protein